MSRLILTLTTASFVSACASNPLRPPELLTASASVYTDFRPADEVNELCRHKADKIGKSLSGTADVKACTFKDHENAPMRLVAPNPCDVRGEAYAALLCHELGHVNEISRNLIPDHRKWDPKVAKEVDWAANLMSAPAYSSYIPAAPTRFEVLIEELKQEAAED